MKAIAAGIPAALGAALLFGAGTPLAKPLLGAVSPWMLAGILYLGSGAGLAAARAARRERGARLARAEIPWLAGAVALGGVAGPVLLLWGLSGMPASSASLLLNAEGLLTALIAWFGFRENFDRRIALGMLLIAAGAFLLAWPSSDGFASALPALAVLGACLAWALDNNLTRRVSLADATQVAMIKGLVAGTVNLVLAIATGSRFPSPALVAAGGLLGFVSYGLSLVLFVRALRALGTARTGAYFSIAPFAGAIISIVLLGDAVTWNLASAAALMAAGLWLHLTEHHAHRHAHEPIEHEHEHEHDRHHLHEHDEPVAPGVRHSHRHRHEAMTHSHEHFPDAHHRHHHH
ncbi:MAG TPA: DMT family transporter [Usitatibacter sp.]|nr:DMT family transporter [Usitatibacter sp.]